MKKVLAIILAVLCLTSCFGVTGYAGAEDIIGGVIGGIIGDDLLGGGEESEDAVLEYGIHYEMETLSMVSLMYKPSSKITFKAPAAGAYRLYVFATDEANHKVAMACIPFLAE